MGLKDALRNNDKPPVEAQKRVSDTRLHSASNRKKQHSQQLRLTKPNHNYSW